MELVVVDISCKTGYEACVPLAPGPGSADKDAACVRANTYVPLSQAIYYFEVQIISKGRDGYIGA